MQSRSTGSSKIGGTVYFAPAIFTARATSLGPTQVTVVMSIETTVGHMFSVACEVLKSVPLTATQR